MTQATEPTDVILVVDDEESVRRSVSDWLNEAKLDVQVLTAADAASAMMQADQHQIDLAILDWNLGAGDNGLDLLHDLATEFNPDIVAIMMTAYADQATPLDAMRKGVRDYLDKNQEFTCETLVAAVGRQLNLIRPAKRERQFHQSLLAFRNAVEKALPLVETQAALNDPVTPPEAIGTFFRFLLNTTRASDGILFVRHYDPQEQPPETCRVFDATGKILEQDLIPFQQSIAAGAVSRQEPCMMTDLDKDRATGAVALQPFEHGRQSLLAAPLAVAPGFHVVLELFDKKNAQGQADAKGFSDTDVRLVRDAGEFGAKMLQQALAQRQSHQLLLDAVQAVLEATASFPNSGLEARQDSNHQESQPPPNVVLEGIRERLSLAAGAALEPADSVRLAEAIRVLAVRHGSPAVKHCIGLVESVQRLLDQATGI